MTDIFQFPAFESGMVSNVQMPRLQRPPLRPILPKQPDNIEENFEVTQDGNADFFDKVKLIRDHCLDEARRSRSSDFSNIGSADIKKHKESAIKKIEKIVSNIGICNIIIFCAF